LVSWWPIRCNKSWRLTIPPLVLRMTEEPLSSGFYFAMRKLALEMLAISSQSFVFFYAAIRARWSGFRLPPGSIAVRLAFLVRDFSNDRTSAGGSPSDTDWISSAAWTDRGRREGGFDCPEAET
jgi:hypothetical protein